MNAQLSYYRDKFIYEIDSSELQLKLLNKEHIVIIDVRSSDAYDKEHIRGAINFPYFSIDDATTGGLKRGALYVCYDDGVGSMASSRGAYNLAKLGFSVKELIGGLEWWKKFGFPTESLETPR